VIAIGLNVKYSRVIRTVGKVRQWQSEYTESVTHSGHTGSVARSGHTGSVARSGHTGSVAHGVRTRNRCIEKFEFNKIV